MELVFLHLLSFLPLNGLSNVHHVFTLMDHLDLVSVAQALLVLDSQLPAEVVLVRQSVSSLWDMVFLLEPRQPRTLLF